LGERVESHRLTADDLMGGTFTMVGAPSVHALWSVPIIIQPQVAVLAAGAVRTVAVVGEGEPAAIESGRRLVLGLSFDHRVCESSVAASYLERVAELLNGLDLASER
jgi:2-oxoglutarate dehydrogenase E2 component (dihydrolipoamide succinyltransferase)